MPTRTHFETHVVTLEYHPSAWSLHGQSQVVTFTVIGGSFGKDRWQVDRIEADIPKPTNGLARGGGFLPVLRNAISAAVQKDVTEIEHSMIQWAEE